MLRKFGIIAVLSLIVAALAAVPALAANPHTVPSGDPVTCTFTDGPDADQERDTITCSGELAGLGQANSIRVIIEAAGGCETPQEPEAANEPPGQIQDVSEPILVGKGGRATFSESATITCPGRQDPVVGQFADITVVDAQTGEILETFENVRITRPA